MHLKVFFRIVIAAAVIIVSCFIYKSFEDVKIIPDKTFGDYKITVEQALRYCKENKLNDQHFFLIDLSVHSGKKRMMLIDMQKNEIEERYMVSHGCGSIFWSMAFTKGNPGISNKLNSHCSSIGKYIIGNKGYSKWGINVNYRLEGMDATNSNALKREIVLHSWDKMPDKEVYPDGSPEGWGCPAVSNEAMKKLVTIIDASDKRILLWIVK